MPDWCEGVFGVDKFGFMRTTWPDDYSLKANCLFGEDDRMITCVLVKVLPTSTCNAVPSLMSHEQLQQQKYNHPSDAKPVFHNGRGWMSWVSNRTVLNLHETLKMGGFGLVGKKRFGLAWPRGHVCLPSEVSLFTDINLALLGFVCSHSVSLFYHNDFNIANHLRWYLIQKPLPLLITGFKTSN